MGAAAAPRAAAGAEPRPRVSSWVTSHASLAARQHGHEVVEAAGDEVVHDAQADDGAQGFEPRHRARAFEARRRAAEKLAHTVERGREGGLLDIAGERRLRSASTPSGAPVGGNAAAATLRRIAEDAKIAEH